MAKRELKNTIEWIDKSRFQAGGVPFELELSDWGRKSSIENFLVLKPREFIERYIEYFTESGATNILEFGIFEGGSTLLFATLFNIKRLAAIDLSDRVEVLDDAIRKYKLGDIVKPYYNTSQGDRKAVTRIIKENFQEGLDIITDDASHLYHSTRQSFEISFPYLKSGGLYIIEDWGWAHWKESDWQSPDHPWYNYPALSNLIFELVMLSASRPDFIEKIEILGSFATITRGTGDVPKDFKLEDYYLNRNRKRHLI